ncbi:nucleoside triphosphate pyrophosphohydrolase [Alteribacter aurantiacus]|uniref:nucleoside triphosphate pyrophosphohydrolase n=1 Tax=Alteribacter aurantiacus TaxID=254410 RepID=UPI000422E86A|nr:nucleoside triphosphate pyrophosphohydrolase [Alteribacter aurantiacus]
MPVYNKLVRDQIPEIIKASGKTPIIKKLSDQDYIRFAKEKLGEELNEYLEAKNDEEAVEELADLMELIQCLAEKHGSSVEQLESVRREKAEKRGSFKEKLYLSEVLHT